MTRLVVIVDLHNGVEDDQHLRDSLRDYVLDYTMAGTKDGPSLDDPGPFGPDKAFPILEVQVAG